MIRTEIQPWTGWQLEDKRTDAYLIAPTTALIPFQIISAGSFVSTEISPHGLESWSSIDLGLTDTTVGSVHYIDYDGSDLDDPLECGIYDLKVTAGEVWFLEPIIVDDFNIDTNDFTRRDTLWTPLRFGENEYWLDGAIVSDGLLPFMYLTDHTSTDPVVYLIDCDCNETELSGFPLSVSVIGDYTYYIYDGSAYSLPENSCGVYRFKITDGEYCYYSVPFEMCDLTTTEYDYTSSGYLTADSTLITADSTIVTADGA